MKRLRYGTAAWRRYLDGLPRADHPRPAVARAVSRILRDVQRDGDRALARWTGRLDGVTLRPSEIRMPASEVRRRAAAADRPLRRAEPFPPNLNGLSRRSAALLSRQPLRPRFPPLRAPRAK